MRNALPRRCEDDIDVFRRRDTTVSPLISSTTGAIVYNGSGSGRQMPKKRTT